MRKPITLLEALSFAYTAGFEHGVAHRTVALCPTTREAYLQNAERGYLNSDEADATQYKVPIDFAAELHNLDSSRDFTS